MYIDTSALVAYYCPEALSDKVQTLLRAQSEPTISALVEVEFYSALSQKVRTHELQADMAKRAADLFQLHQADNLYRVVPLGPREYRLSRDWLSRFDSPLRALDSLHLAAAFANDLTLVSADRGLIRCAAQFAVEHELIA